MKESRKELDRLLLFIHTYIGQAGGDAHQPRPAPIGSNKISAQIALILPVIIATPALVQRLRGGCIDLLFHCAGLQKDEQGYR